MMRRLLLILPLCLLAAPLAAQTAAPGTGGTGGNLLDPLGSRTLYPPGTVNPNLMPRPGGGTPATSGSQVIANPNGGLPSGAATAAGQPGQAGGGGRRGGGGGGGLAPGVTPVPSVGGGRGGTAGSGSASGAFSVSGGRSSGGTGGRGGGASGGNATSRSAAPVGRAAQWVLCPGADSEIAAELGGGMRCAP